VCVKYNTVLLDEQLLQQQSLGVACVCVCLQPARIITSGDT